MAVFVYLALIVIMEQYHKTVCKKRTLLKQWHKNGKYKILMTH